MPLTRTIAIFLLALGLFHGTAQERSDGNIDAGALMTSALTIPPSK